MFHPDWKVAGRYGHTQGSFASVLFVQPRGSLWMNRSWLESVGDMRSFYGHGVPPNSGIESTAQESPHGTPSETLYIRTRARVAVYEAPGAAPRVVDVEADSIGDFIEQLAATVHRLSREQGSEIPYTVLREVTENFIHAHFQEPVVSILNQGTTVRFADQGPGMGDKVNAVLPGFTTAAGEMKRYIRGVGSGLPIVRDYLSLSGGSLVIEDNLGCGSVVTIHSRTGTVQDVVPPGGPLDVRVAEGISSTPQQDSFSTSDSSLRLSTRQQQVLALVMESGLAGPSLVAKELGVGVSTAYRDLASLEEAQLIEADGGKRTLTEAGLRYIHEVIAR